MFIGGIQQGTGYSFIREAAPKTFTWDFADVLGAASVEFRFYGWDSQNANGEVRIDSVALSGTVVPEPQTYLPGKRDWFIGAGCGQTPVAEALYILPNSLARRFSKAPEDWRSPRR